jgi:hypothetical protein
MAHFARIVNEIVQEVIVVANDAIGGGVFPDAERIGQAFIESLGLAGDWLQCSYSGSFRSAFPGFQWTYDPVADAFVPPAATDALAP